MPLPLQNKKRGAQVVKSVCPAFCSFFAQAAVPERSALRAGKAEQTISRFLYDQENGGTESPQRELQASLCSESEELWLDLTNLAVAQKNYLCHSLHIPPQAFIIRYTALFSNVDSGYFSRISTLFSITFQQNGVVMVYQTVLYQPDIFRSCRSDDPGKSTSFAICSAAWS